MDINYSKRSQPFSFKLRSPSKVEFHVGQFFGLQDHLPTQQTFWQQQDGLFPGPYTCRQFHTIPHQDGTTFHIDPFVNCHATCGCCKQEKANLKKNLWFKLMQVNLHRHKERKYRFQRKASTVGVDCSKHKDQLPCKAFYKLFHTLITGTR